MKKLSKLIKEIDITTFTNIKNEKIISIIFSKLLKNNKNDNLFSSDYSNDYIKSLISNHLYFLKELLKINDTNSICNHLIWEVKTYSKMGFSNHFFKFMYICIIESLKEIDEKKYNNIIDFYNYISKNFEILLIDNQFFENEDINLIQNNILNEFVNSLLEPNLSKAISISKNEIKTKDDLKIFLEHIILPSLYSIGSKWSNGEITVGQEHTATSICQRVMSIHYEKILDGEINKKKILVSISPNELHEIGARMISDLLELNDYDTYYFGANSDISEIIKTIKEENIEAILISTTLVSNLNSTNEMIKEIKEKIQNKNLKVFVGGQAYKFNTKNDNINYDAYISSFDELLETLEKR
jgi:methanogenic corrinoid protein MtbC1